MSDKMDCHRWVYELISQGLPEKEEIYITDIKPLGYPGYGRDSNLEQRETGVY